MPHPEIKIYTAENVAEILQVHIGTVRRFVQEGRLETMDNVGQIRVTEKQLMNFINGNTDENNNK